MSSKLCNFLGDISYPLYITHYPLVYTYFGWISKHQLTFGESWPGSLLVIAASITLAYVCLKLYDIPVRKWLSKKILK